MRARTWRSVPRTRTKSTTAMPAPLERAWTIGIPFTTVLTSECVCPLTIKSTALDQGPWLGPLGPRRAARIGDVGGEKAILRPRHAGPQRVDRPVELVVADRRGVDAERVHRRDRGQPEREVREQRALHLVAAVQPDGGAAARAGERVEPRLERGGAAHGSPAGPRPGARLERPVKVVDREHPEYGGVPLTQRRCGGRKRGV